MKVILWILRIFIDIKCVIVELDINERVSSRNRATPHVYIKQKSEDK